MTRCRRRHRNRANPPLLKHPPPRKDPEVPGNPYAIGDGVEFLRNMTRVGLQSQKLLGDFVKRQTEAGSGPRDPLNLADTFMALLNGMAAHPSAMIEAQFQLWRGYMGLWESAAQRMLGGSPPPVVAPETGDRRFRDKDWQENQIFDFIKQSYLLTANWMQSTVAQVQGLDPATQKRAEFYTKQFADAVAPTNLC